MNKVDGRGLFWGFISYSMWGFFPLYWKLLSTHAATEILVHRVFWAFVFYTSLFAIINRHGSESNIWIRLRGIFTQSRRDWLLITACAGLLTLNWGVYIYAVLSGQVLEGSLAYFINPIMNVAVGVLFFREPFPWSLRLSVGFAFFGVLAKILYSPGFPWIALVLATSFCLYGVAKKLLLIPAITSSVLESSIGVVPAVAAIAYFQTTNTEPTTLATWALFAGGGVVTGVPLFLFSFAAQRISYSVMGMMQFIAPTLQFIVAVVLFEETFGPIDLLSFGLIWIGMFFYLGNQVLNRSR